MPPDDETTLRDAPTAMQLAPRMQIGRYRLERELGSGGMGVVWLAADPMLKRRVAIKFLRRDRGASLGEERFLREARAMARLSHPCVVPVFDLGSEGDRVFFTMEYLDGGTLKHWLAAEPRTWREIVEMFVAAGRGLAAAHSAGLVHRDFKPGNVLVGGDRCAKVADFGIARPIGGGAPAASAPPADSLGLTDPGTVAGTPGYMAPEVLAGEVAGPAADQFAFAVSLHDVLARLPEASVPQELAAIIARGLAAAPGDRHASMHVMIAELQRVLTPDRARELRFGLPPSDPLSTKRQHAAELSRELADRFGLRLQASFAADYQSLVEDLVAERLDLAWLPPLSLLRAERRVRPILVLERAGRSSFHGALVARADSGISGIADLAGKRIGWVDADSAGGYVLARATIAERYPDVDAYLGPQRFLGSHRAVVEAVLEGWVDVGATFLNYGRDGTVALTGWWEFLGDRGRELSPIAITGAIPGDVIAVRWHLPPEDTAAVIATLRDFAADPAGRPLLARVFNGVEGFCDVRPRDYEELAKLAVRAGWRP